MPMKYRQPPTSSAHVALDDYADIGLNYRDAPRAFEALKAVLDLHYTEIPARETAVCHECGQSRWNGQLCDTLNAIRSALLSSPEPSFSFPPTRGLT